MKEMRKEGRKLEEGQGEREKQKIWMKMSCFLVIFNFLCHLG